MAIGLSVLMDICFELHTLITGIWATAANVSHVVDDVAMGSDREYDHDKLYGDIFQHPHVPYRIELTCCICLYDPEDGEEWALMPCQHAMHSLCFRRLLNAHITHNMQDIRCCMCSYEFDVRHTRPITIDCTGTPQRFSTKPM